jgi:signal transduction histidine kinase
MTSHEMRNPLSAVIQCADSSIDAINQISKLVSQIASDNLENNRRQIQEHIKTSLDAQQTIVSCSLHQKRVTDDILTLSKLDSNLILITPIRVQPVAVVAEAVKMFEVESSKEGIDLSFFEDPSLSITGASWVMMDPSRLLQVSNHYSSADRTRDKLFRSSLTF